MVSNPIGFRHPADDFLLRLWISAIGDLEGIPAFFNPRKLRFIEMSQLICTDIAVDPTADLIDAMNLCPIGGVLCRFDRFQNESG